MAELLIVVVAVVVLLLYAADRARKLRVRARQMAAMNDRLDVAAAKVDAQQQKKRAVVRASAELTSVTAGDQAASPDDPGDDGARGPPGGGRAAGGRAGRGGGPGNSPACGARPACGGPRAGEGRPVGGRLPACRGCPIRRGAPAGETLPAEETGAGEAREPEPAENTLSMAAGVTADEVPVLKLQVTTEGTLIMPAVPDQGPVPAGETLPAHGPDAQRAHR